MLFMFDATFEGKLAEKHRHRGFLCAICIETSHHYRSGCIAIGNYDHEVRARVRRLKALTDDSKRRTERRAEHVGSGRAASFAFLDEGIVVQTDFPINFLMVAGHGATIHTNNDDLYRQIENGTGGIHFVVRKAHRCCLVAEVMTPWNREPDSMIDRYDG